jgi:transcriptional regulator with XRE-family HTH domain
MRRFNMPKYIKTGSGLPETIRTELIEARHKRGWSQDRLGRQVGLPQEHISVIERGKIVPRFDTLLEIFRALDRELLIVPRTLVPAVLAIIRDQRGSGRDGESTDSERPLYAFDPEEESDET